MKTIKIPAFQESAFSIKYCEGYRKSHIFEIESHTHTECEIYVNLSGDISFFCNGKTYPMTRGDVLIARPGDAHHCIYHSNALHQHFWILFDYENNRHLWDTFFKTPFENVLRPSRAEKEKIIKLCERLYHDTLSNGECTFLFWTLLSILKEADSVQQQDLPINKEFIHVLDYIHQHIHEKLTVADLAQKHFISIGTLERHFIKHLNIRPAQYVKQKKMMAASEFLKSGRSVSGTADAIGYNDCSYFIEIFKDHFGMTPLQYAKSFAEVKAEKDT